MLRAEVLTGQARPEGLGALVYHGMLNGLALILTSPPVAPAVPGAAARPVAPIPNNRQFVRLLANMLLLTQSEVVHVY